MKEYDQQVKEMVVNGYDRYEIAKQLGISYARVGYALARAGHEFRSRSRNLDESLARRLVKEGLTGPEIAARCCVQVSTVQGWACRRGLKIKRVEKEVQISPEKLRRLVAEGLTCKEISERTGATLDAIKNTRIKHSIPFNPHGLAKRFDLPKLVAEGLTLKEIATHCGAKYKTVTGACWKLGLTPRKKERGKSLPRPPFDLDLLRLLIEGHRLKQKEVAKILGQSEGTLSHWCVRSKIVSPLAEDIKRLRSYGLKEKQIALVVGVCCETVHNHFRRQDQAETKDGWELLA